MFRFLIMVKPEIKERFVKEKKQMDIVFDRIEVSRDRIESQQFLDMAINYYKDSDYFYGKKDYLRAFEAIVISWAYVDAGIKMGFFNVPEDMKPYFTS